jgi:hypothetical protein
VSCDEPENAGNDNRDPLVRNGLTEHTQDRVRDSRDPISIVCDGMSPSVCSARGIGASAGERPDRGAKGRFVDGSAPPGRPL